MLNRSGVKRHYCLFPKLKEKAFNISPFSMMYTIGFIGRYLFVKIMQLSSIPSLPTVVWVFFNQGKWVDFYQTLFYIC